MKINDLPELSQELLKRAGITDELLAASKKPDVEFEEIVDTLKLIHQGKAVLYGNYIESHKNDGDLLMLVEHYADLKRKYVRVDNFVKKMVNEGEKISYEEQLDSFSDLAVYSLLGIQVALYLRKKERMEKTSDV